MRLASRFILLLTLLIGGCASGHKSDAVYQISTIDALLAGDYQGTRTMAQLRRHGDFGIGTFHALDGEMVVLNGQVYQVRSNGQASIVNDDETTPLAVVKFFDPETAVAVPAGLSLDQLSQHLDQHLSTANWFYAIRIDGTFPSIKTRSVPRQSEPYPKLVEVVKTQATWEMENVAGTLVGFRCPDYARSLNVPGYHWHFITSDRNRGGHVLTLTTGEHEAKIDASRQWSVELPDSSGFKSLDLSHNRETELDKVEK